jgi:hypothetical protein
MGCGSGRLRRFALTVVALGLAVGPLAPQAAAAPLTGRDQVRFRLLKGFDELATPDDLDRVGVLQVGPERAKNVLVLSPGTSAGAGYFLPLAEDVVSRTHGRWQVWSVERRENLLEDQSVLDQAKQGTDSRLTLVNRESTYAHNDPSAASPTNEFLDNLVPFLAATTRP